MYSEELCFDEDEFLRIYREETAIALKHNASFFRRGLPIDANSATVKAFITDIKKVVNFVYNTAYQAISPRYVAVRSGDTKLTTIPESIGGHTLIMTPIYLGLRDVLKNHYFSTPEEVFLEAIRIHDLPENKFSDIPDNGCSEHDKGNKEYLEREQMLKYREFIPKYKRQIFDAAMKLLDSKATLETIDARIFYLTDKIAAILLPLTGHHNYVSTVTSQENINPSLVSEEYYPRIYFDYTNVDKLASREREELKIIRGTRKPTIPVPAYELWSADFLAVRKMTAYDDYGYFTALIVAYTLACTGEWYSWREAMYTSSRKSDN